VITELVIMGLSTYAYRKRKAAIAHKGEREIMNKFKTAMVGAGIKNNMEEANTFEIVSINKKDYEAASKYLGADYKQHNPLVEDGKDGFKAFLAMLRKDFPQAHSEVKRVFADGNYVIIHVHSIRVPNTPGRAIFDCFQFDGNGKIVEHWDAIQDIPVKAANPNGMF
jgi:predicted SnoaL-like aldol condensation-catalyzing enzyme